MSQALKAIGYLLSESTDVTTIVDDRIYAVVAAQDQPAYPLIVMSTVSRGTSPTQDADSAVDEYRVQLDLITEMGGASPVSVLTTLQEAVRSALVFYRGDADGVDVDGLISDGEGDEYDPEYRLWRKRLDFIIRIKPAK